MSANDVSTKYHAGTVTRPTLGKQAERLELGFQENRQEVSQRDVRVYTRSTISKLAATEQNKSAITDHAVTLNPVIDWDQAKVIDRESNKMDRWIKEATCFRKEQDQLMNRDERSYQLSHVYDKLFAVATSSGERESTTSFRRRQQLLPKRQQ